MGPHHPRLGVRVPGDVVLQTQAGPVTVEALEAIPARSMVQLLQRLEGQPPELMVALLPSLIRTMLTAFVEVMAEQHTAKV